MRKFISMVLLTAVFLASGGNAMPPRQHVAVGEILVIDHQKIIVVRSPGGSEEQSTFVIVSGRTRFHENGKESSFERLRVGLEVRIYFKRERGVLVAISVSWRLPSTLEAVSER